MKLLEKSVFPFSDVTACSNRHGSDVGFASGAENVFTYKESRTREDRFFVF